MAKDLIGVMNDLIHLDIDAVGAYEQAINACEVPEIKSKLMDFRGDHERHIQDLSKLVLEAGGAPETKRDVKSFFIEGFTAVMSRGDKSALLAMRGNEELTSRSYRAALEEESLTPDARRLVEQNYADEQRHLAWIKQALDSRLYETKGKAA